MATRVPIIDASRCQPNKCNFECGLACPVNKRGTKCVELVDIEDIGNTRRIARVNESVCIGCGLCASSAKKGCPFDAVKMVQIPNELEGEQVHRYGENGFRLYRLPRLRQNTVIGILGRNGIGKSTLVAILKGNIVPPCGSVKSPETCAMLEGISVGRLTTFVKEQKIIEFAKKNRTMRFNFDLSPLGAFLDMHELDGKTPREMSGGQVQRLMCFLALTSSSDILVFDEPMNHLDVHMRLRMAEAIRSVSHNRTVIVIEHDLTMLDYLADTVHILYGTPGAFGVVSHPMTASHAIRAVFEGYIKVDNMRFRDHIISLSGLDLNEQTELEDCAPISLPKTIVHAGSFSCTFLGGFVPSRAALVVIIGENGTGKTTLVKHFASTLGSSIAIMEQLSSSSSDDTLVMDALHNTGTIDSAFRSDILRPLGVEPLFNRHIRELSGGELQRVRITQCLLKDAEITLLDEPSSHLDIEQRVILAKILKRFAIHRNKLVFVVEHDMMVAVSLGAETRSHVVVFERTSALASFAQLLPFKPGLNQFLRRANMTFRSDTQGTDHPRPRINKLGSVKDREQKASGVFYE